MDEIGHIGQNKIFYKQIDNSLNTFESSLGFQQGGTIIVPYGVEFNELHNKISSIYNSYFDEHPVDNFENKIFSERANYYIKFVKDKAIDIYESFKDTANQISSPVILNNILPDDGFDSKNTIVLNRNDVPLSIFYQNGLNKVQNAVCLDNGKINISQWKVKVRTNLFRDFVSVEDEYESVDFDYNYNLHCPSFSSTSFSVRTSLTNDDRCVGIQPTSAPKSSFEIIIYTNNETYIEILEKLNFFIVLTESDLDASSKLKSKTSKNYVVAVLDDLPDGKSINLDGIKSSSNVFLVGFKANTINDFFDLIQNLDDLYQVIDVISDDEYYQKKAQHIIKITSKINEYRPKASLTVGSLNSLVISSVNYYGTKIRCTRFWALLCNLINIDQLKANFRAQITLTETITYKLISDLPIVDLVLFPVSIDPPNLMSVEMINMTESHWNLLLNPIYDDKGFWFEPIHYPIQTKKVSGHLCVYSFRYKCTFNALDTKDGQVLKGISFLYLNRNSVVLREIQGMITLDDWKPKPKSIVDQFKAAFNFINEIRNNEIQHKKTRHLFTKESDDDEETVRFTGNWEKVSSVNGRIEINTAIEPVIIKQIPSVVASVIDVQSDDKISLGISGGSVNFAQAQVVSSAKTIDIKGAATDVSFSNIRFEGLSPQLALVVGGETVSVRAKNITVDAGTAASIAGGLEVCDLELGAESSLSTESGSSSMMKDCRLKLEYRLSSQFADIPDFVTPNSIILSYIGEPETSVTYSSFVNKSKPIKVFTGDDHMSHCNSWLSRSSLVSDIYTEFRSDSKIVSLICISNSSASTFALNVTSVAKGETEIIEPNDEYENFTTVQPASGTKNVDIDVDDDASSSGSDGNNDGLSVGAIVGIVVAVVIVVVGVVALLVWMLVIRKKKDKMSSSAEETDANNVTNKVQTKSTPNNLKNIKIKRKNEENNDNNESSDDYDFWM